MLIGETSIDLPFVHIPAATSFTPGRGSDVIEAKDWKFQVTLCVEDLFREGSFYKPQEPKPDLLISLASDAWFLGTTASQLHLQLSKLRAIETGTYVVRAVNAGSSALIDPAGQVITGVPDEQLGSLLVNVPRIRAPVSLGTFLVRKAALSALCLGIIVKLFELFVSNRSSQAARRR